jgi:hypothetical protein
MHFSGHHHTIGRWLNNNDIKGKTSITLKKFIIRQPTKPNHRIILITKHRQEAQGFEGCTWNSVNY